MNDDLTTRLSDFRVLADRLKGNSLSTLLFRTDVHFGLMEQLRYALMAYVSRCIGSDYPLTDEAELITEVVARRETIPNLTANGNLIPKRPVALEYNLLARAYAAILEAFGIEDLIIGVHFPFNVRIKFPAASTGFNRTPNPTETMHLDAWTGANPEWVIVHLLMLGDIERNHVRYAGPAEGFRESWLAPLAKVSDWQLGEECYDVIEFVPQKNTVLIGDGSVFHQSYRADGAGVRISIDTGFDLHRSAVSDAPDSIVGGRSVRRSRAKEQLSPADFFSIGRTSYFHFPDGFADHVDRRVGNRHASTVKHITLG